MVEIRHKTTGMVLLAVDADSLAGADLEGANLVGADLRGSPFAQVGVVSATVAAVLAILVSSEWAERVLQVLLTLLVPALEARSLQRAVGARGGGLQGANLRGANLTGADLSFANLRGADLRGASLFGATLRRTSLHGATFDHATQWPTGFTGYRRQARLLLADAPPEEMAATEPEDA